MAKHKAATSVTIASTTDRTALHAFVEENWKLAALAAVIVTGIILGKQFLNTRSESAAGGSWDELRTVVPFTVESPSPYFPAPDEVGFENLDTAALAGLAEDLRGKPAGPWAMAILAGKYLRDGNRAEALATITEAEAEYGDHPAFHAPLPFDADGEAVTLKAFLESRANEVDAWEAAHPLLFANPPLPEGSPRVRLITDEGPIVVGLYLDEAPLHTANFIKLCQEGYYNGTRFHRVVPGRLIQGGDPNSRDGEPDTWGMGGPDETIPPERNGLSHFAHVLAMAKKSGDPNSSGSQFYITSTPQHVFDGDYVVFGTVLEGAALVDSMANAPVQGERPEKPVVLQSTEVLAD